ncbi:spore coat associated protein CotJA [Anaerosinus massiliensis]|uniref:spore coat associated protein CotJA n=1 Tax=Massilibacillus massiliensis TaxID=1806837 RepID=UPI000AFBD91D|nr:spore coat associated protein CotJA [Massilibacillus massiliensis]
MEEELRPCIDDCNCKEDLHVIKKHKMCSNRMLAHSYMKWQSYEKAFCPREALMKGTLFPELWGVYRIPK